MSNGQRLKVLHVVVAGQIGGAENFLVDLATRPELSGAEHCLALMTPNAKLRAFFVEAGLGVHDRGPTSEAPLAYLWRTFGPSWLAWLGRVIAEEKPDVLHAHTYGSFVLAARAGARFGVPVVRTEHGIRHYFDPSCAPARHWALRHTDRLVAISDFVAREVEAIAPYAKGKIVKVMNATDLARFAPVPPPQDGPFTVTSVCRLVSTKRLWMAIEAVAKVPDIRLHIVGQGPERESLEKLAQKLGVQSRVQFFGYVPDMRPLIASADAFINCRQAEPFGIAVIEAAAMQRPVIAFGAGGIPEIIEDRRTGWLVHEDSVEALAAVMREASSSRERAAEFGVRARRSVDPKFGIERMCREYGDVYADVAAQRAVRRTHVQAQGGSV